MIVDFQTRDKIHYQNVITCKYEMLLNIITHYSELKP